MRASTLRTLGAFEIGRSIGRGPRGEVFIARTPWPDAPVCALKVLAAGHDPVPGLAARLASEVASGKRLEHPNVVAVLGAGTAANRPYVASELVLGKSVARIVERTASLGRTISIAISVRILADVLTALAWLHERTMHGRVTATNVLVTYAGVAKLSDLGMTAVDRITPSADVLAAASIFESLRAGTKLTKPLEALIAQIPENAATAADLLLRTAVQDEAPASRVAVGRWLSEIFSAEKEEELEELDMLRGDREDEVELPSFANPEEEPTDSSWSERTEEEMTEGFMNEPTELFDEGPTIRRPGPLSSSTPLDRALTPLAMPRNPNVRTVVLSDEIDSGRESIARAPTDPIGEELFGPYALRGKLGQGGMAEVLLAERNSGEGKASLCVIKRISPALRLDRDFQEMFLEEARIARTIHHPNIVECIDAGSIDDIAYIAMELVEGLGLASLIENIAPSAVPASAAIEIAIGIARALDHAHRLTGPDGKPLDLVHRDVSPENVMVSWTGSVKLLDFGISRFRDRAHVTRIGVRKGKVGYMAPEYVNGAQIDARADLFQLGLTLAETLGGAKIVGLDAAVGPMTVEAMRAALGRHVKAREVPRELFELLVRLCAPDPKDRPSSARDVIVELERIASQINPSPKLEAIVRLYTPTGALDVVVREDPQAEVRTGIIAPTGRKWMPLIGILVASAIAIAIAIAIGIALMIAER